MITDEFCFVIMPFNNDSAGIYFDGIKPAVENQGLKCIRVDEVTDPGSIIKRIVEHIKQAKVVIADLTGRNANVFYELGIAHSLGNNTIVITQNGSDVPFDVNSYHYITYNDSISGARKLNHDISEKINSINKWSLKPTNPVQDFLPEPEKMITIGQFTDVLSELNSVKSKLASSQLHLQDYEDMKRNYTNLLERSKELETVEKYLGLLFKANSAQEVYERVQKEGQVSISVEPVEKGGKKNKIVFTKIGK